MSDFAYVEKFIHNHVWQNDRNRAQRYADKKNQTQPAMGAVLPFMVPTTVEAVSCAFVVYGSKLTYFLAL